MTQYIKADQSIGCALKWALLSFLVLIASTSLFFIDVDSYEIFAKEDGIAENLSFLFYLVAGIFLLMASFNNTHSQARGVLPVLLGLFFVVVAGEEISWGQRLFNFDTPGLMAKENTQGEFNFHNLSAVDKNDSILNQHTLLNIFVLLNGVVIPIAYYFFGFVNSMITRLKFPVIPVSCTPVFLIAILYGQVVPKLYPHWAHVEVKELVFSLGFFVFSIAFFRGDNVIDKAG